MRLLRLADVPLSTTHQVFRYSPARALVAAVAALCASAVLLWLGWHHLFGLAYYLSGVLLLGLVIMQTFVRARFRPSNWLVRTSDEGLFVQFRSYLNYQFPEDNVTVVYIPFKEVRSARVVRLRRSIVDRSVPPQQIDRIVELRRRLVELELNADLAPLVQALAEESARCGPDAREHGVTSTRYQHYPVRVVPPATVQLEWKVVPRSEVLLDVLRRHATILEPVQKSEDYVHLDGLGREEQEQRLLELAETGETLAAIVLARTLYSYDLTQAQAFVEDLRRGKTSRTDPPRK